MVTTMDTVQAFLGLIEAERSRGYSLKHRYNELFESGRQWAFGRVYTMLAGMVRDGLIELLETESGDGPNRKRYAILPTGRIHVRPWFAESPAIRAAGLLKCSGPS